MSLDSPTVRGADRLARRIATIRATLALPALVVPIGELLLKRTLKRFDDQVDPDNQPWAPLKDETLIAKRRLGFGNKGILKRTNKLRNSIKLIRGGLGSVYTNTGANSRIGVDDPGIVVYARAHQRGTKNIPARRFLGIGRLDIKAVDTLMRRRAREAERDL